jgi:hypothetical protein
MTFLSGVDAILEHDQERAAAAAAAATANAVVSTIGGNDSSAGETSSYLRCKTMHWWGERINSDLTTGKG